METQTQNVAPKRPRLLFVVNSDWFFVSHRLRLAEAARGAGFDVEVAAPESDASSTIRGRGFEFHPIHVDRGGTNPARDLRTFVELSRLYRRIRPDLIHHVTLKPIVYGGLAARLLRIPALNSVAGLGHAFQKDAGLRMKLVRRLMGVQLELALDHGLAWAMFQNASDRDHCRSEYSTDPSRDFLVPGSGVDLSHFVPTPIPSAPVTVLLPARLLWAKGVGDFVEAADLVRRQRPEWRFVVAGRLDPENPGSISRTVLKDWIDGEKIEWLGAIDQREMPDVYRRASVVVLPSFYGEGLPLALAEAQASGRAVITTDSPGCRDAIANHETGWLVPPRNPAALAAQILEAVSDRSELERRSRAARALAESRFDERAIFRQIVQAYRRVLASSR